MMAGASGNKRIWNIAAITAAMFLLLCLYALADPSDPVIGRFFPKCPVKLATGLQCPACGLQRAFHLLLHGDVAGALSQNWFIIFSLAYVAGLLVTRRLPLCSGARNFFWGKAGGYLFVTLYLVWFVVRNLLHI